MTNVLLNEQVRVISVVSGLPCIYFGIWLVL